MNAIELNVLLLKGAIKMREDERRWHNECFGHLDVEFTHQFMHIETAVPYWLRYNLLPVKEELCLDLPKIGKRDRRKRIKKVRFS